MKEILFRGKRVGNGEWVYGYYVFQRKRRGAYGQTITNLDFDRHLIITKCGESYEVIPETVGQYIGKQDKNGKKIFEGDIVDILTENEERGVITYNDGCFIVEADGFILTFIDHLYGTDVEVIGNIHDNHELLEGE